MAISLRSRLSRFTPESEIEFLSHDQRKNFRKTIKILTDIVTKLEKGDNLSPNEEAMILGLTHGSEARDTRLNAGWDLLERTEANYKTKLAAMAPYDLTAYHEMINPHEPPASHHIFMCNELMKVARGETATLAMSWPPGSSKSTYASRSFAQWYMGKNPDHRVLALGNTQKFGEDEFSKPNRGALMNEDYQLAFPDVQLNPTEKGASFWRLDGWRGSYAVRGVGAGTAGLRAHLILGDDLYKNAEDAMSPTTRESVWRWWTADIMPRRLPNAPIILVNTRWFSQDVIGRLMEMAERNPESVPQPFVAINIPVQSKDSNDPLGREPGEWLWCSDQQEDGYYSIQDYVAKREGMSPSLWSALYEGIPLDQKGGFVTEDQFQRYSKPPVNKQNQTIQWTKTVISIDTAQKGQERSDYTAMLVFRVGVDGSHYLVDVWRDKKPLDEIVRVMSRLMRVWQANYALIEDSGMGAQILENYKGKMPSPIIAYTPSGRGSKEFRFDAATPWIIGGKILFPETAPWLTDLINEFIAVPNGTNDDQADAFAQYTDHELKTKVGGTKPLRARI